MKVLFCNLTKTAPIGLLAFAGVFIFTLIPVQAANITYTVSGSQMVLSWPVGQNWHLQSQTNNPNVGLQTPSNTWFTVTGATPPYSVTMSPANAAVFYRLAQSAGTNFFIYNDALASGWS